MTRPQPTGKRYIILDDLVPQEFFLTDYEDVRNAIREFTRQDALTVMEYDLGEGTCSVVTEDVARDWFDHHADFCGLDEARDLPDFLWEHIGETEIHDSWNEYKQGAKAFA